MFTVNHRIGEITFQTGSDWEIPAFHNPHYRPFLSPEAPPDVVQRLVRLERAKCNLPPLPQNERGAFSACIQFPQVFDRALFRSAGVQAALEVYRRRPDEVALRAQLNADESECALVVADFAARRVDYFLITEDANDAIRFIIPLSFAPLMPLFSAVQVHCAGVVHRGKAALFLAPNAGGKTTAAASTPGLEVLSDDQVVLRGQAGEFMAYGTPWGKHTSPGKAPLGGFFILEKADHFELVACQPLEVLDYLQQEHAALWEALPSRYRQPAQLLLWQACRQAPAYRLRFTRQGPDWDAIGAVLV
jgi:hypothetical protein